MDTLSPSAKAQRIFTVERLEHGPRGHMKERQRSWFSEIPPKAVRALAVNGFLTKQGKGVFGGKGILYAAKKVWPGIEKRWGAALRHQERPEGHAAFDSGRGNHVALINNIPPVLAFPTKWSWWEDADLQLIERSCAELVRVVDGLQIPEVYLHPIGDGHSWEEIREIFNRYFDNRFIVCFGDYLDS